MHNKSVAKVSDNEIVSSDGESGSPSKIHRTRESVSMYSGPLPHPEMLREYALLIPDAPERILKMAERQNEHRTEIEKIFVTGNFKLESRGTIFGFTIPIIGMICGTIIILSGKDIVGFGAILITLLPSASSFVYGQYTRHKNEDKKSIDEEESHTESGKGEHS